jgi:hypothetical protein
MNTRSLAHFIWIGDAGMSPLYQRCLNSFVEKHPYWKVKVWLQKDVDKVIERSSYSHLFNRYTSFINRYNFIKYHILAEEGGWFVDLDIEWKLSIDQIYTDVLKGSKRFPQMFVPVRSLPMFPISNKANDDMLIYADKGLMWSLIDFISKRDDIDESKKYEPFGPLSLSQWLHGGDITREYLYENQIQVNGYYCNHHNGQSWKHY